MSLGAFYCGYERRVRDLGGEYDVLWGKRHAIGLCDEWMVPVGFSRTSYVIQKSSPQLSRSVNMHRGLHDA